MDFASQGIVEIFAPAERTVRKRGNRKRARPAPDPMAHDEFIVLRGTPDDGAGYSRDLGARTKRDEAMESVTRRTGHQPVSGRGEAPQRRPERRDTCPACTLAVAMPAEQIVTARRIEDV